MEDIHNFASNEYKPADRIQRNDSLLLKIGIYCKVTVLTIGVFFIGVYKVIFGWWNTPCEPKNISGQVALVTGGANGLGRAIAIELAKLGCHVAVADVDFSSAKKTSEDLRNLGVMAAAYNVDVSDYEQVSNLRQSIENDIGPVDILINNAGILSGVSILRSKPEDFQRIINVNLTAQFWTLLVFLEGMHQRRRGHIVSISSVFGWEGFAGAEGYCATKYGIRGMMDALAEELRWSGSAVNLTTVFPNFINTRKELADKMLSPTCLSKDWFKLSLNTPEEVAAIAVNGMRKNQRHVFMDYFTTFAAPIYAALPAVLHDTINDYLKPRFSECFE